MRNQCEVCKGFRPEGHPRKSRDASAVSFGAERVFLCTGHALIAKNSAVTSLAELRDLYRESDGKRSYVARRTRAAKRPAKDRRGGGRRAADSV